MKRQFDSITPELIRQRKSVHELCRQYTRSPSKGNLKRLKSLFHTCGEEVFIEYGFHMDYGDNIEIGDRVFINANCTIIDGAKVANSKIQIGADCLLGPNVQLLAVSHDMEASKRLAKANYADDIIIGNNVWLGGGVTIQAGVTIGDNSIIGAGSVVTNNIEENSFYAGVPAVKIRAL
ncbi:MAG: sugar O-acetyltransferase [Colwellia sp.]|nr:sugar O-acetyltransferase [Colwellia sp.]MCW9080332.1 sugar O-acetyltransferase [Colwellia sp.]